MIGEELNLVVGRIEGLVAQVLQIPEANIKDSLAMAEVEAWDSLKHMELVVALESAFDIQFTFEEIVAMQSVQEIKRVVGSIVPVNQ